MITRLLSPSLYPHPTTISAREQVLLLPLYLKWYGVRVGVSMSVVVEGLLKLKCSCSGTGSISGGGGSSYSDMRRYNHIRKHLLSSSSSAAAPASSWLQANCGVVIGYDSSGRICVCYSGGSGSGGGSSGDDVLGFHLYLICCTLHHTTTTTTTLLEKWELLLSPLYCSNTLTNRLKAVMNSGGSGSGSSGLWDLSSGSIRLGGEGWVNYKLFETLQDILKQE